MLEVIAVYVVLLVLVMFAVIIPVFFIFNRKRRLALKQVLVTCDPLDTKLKDFIAKKMEKEKPVRRLFNEALCSFRPYLNAYLDSELDSGGIKDIDLNKYSNYDKKIKLLLRFLFVGLGLILGVLIFVGLADV